MRAPAVAAEVLRGPVEPEPRSEPRPELGDLRFRALMTEEEWLSLPLAIRRRFSRRLIGGPLPLTRDIQGRGIRAPIMHVASVVTVTEDMAPDGQIWTRLYARRK